MPARTRSVERQRADGVPHLARGIPAGTGRIQLQSARGRPKTLAGGAQHPRTRSRSTHAAVQRKITRSPAVSFRSPAKAQPSPKIPRTWPRTSFVVLAILAIWLLIAYPDRLCHNHAVKTTSDVFSGTVNIDLCESIPAISNRLANGSYINEVSPGLAVIREGQAIGNQVKDLQDSLQENHDPPHDLRDFHSATYTAFLNLAELATEFKVANDHDRKLYGPIAGMVRTAEQVASKIDLGNKRHVERLYSAVSLSVSGFDKLRLRLENLVLDAETPLTWQTWLKKTIPEEELLTALAKESSKSDSKLLYVYRESVELRQDISKLRRKLGSIKSRLQNLERNTTAECDRWNEYMKQFEGQETLLEALKEEFIPWKKSRAPSRMGQSVMKSRCEAPIRKHIETFGNASKTFASLASNLAKTGEKFHALSQSLEHMRRTTERRIHLPFFEYDKELAHAEISQLAQSNKEIQNRWTEVLTNGPKDLPQVIRHAYWPGLE